MHVSIEIDEALLAGAQQASGNASINETVEHALRLLVRLQRQREVGTAFGKFRWRGNLAASRKGRIG